MITVIPPTSKPHICHFFTRAKFLENKIYTEKRVNYDMLHSKLPIFRVKSVKVYTGQFFLHRHRLWCLWQIQGMERANGPPIPLSFLLLLSFILDNILKKIFSPGEQREGEVGVKVKVKKKVKVKSTLAKTTYSPCWTGCCSLQERLKQPSE